MAPRVYMPLLSICTKLNVMCYPFACTQVHMYIFNFIVEYKIHTRIYICFFDVLEFFFCRVENSHQMCIYASLMFSEFSKTIVMPQKLDMCSLRPNACGTYAFSYFSLSSNLVKTIIFYRNHIFISFAIYSIYNTCFVGQIDG